MKLHFSFKEWDDCEVEVYRTLEDGADCSEVVDAFSHFLSMAYGYPISVKVDDITFNFPFHLKDKTEENPQQELDL